MYNLQDIKFCMYNEQISIQQALAHNITLRTTTTREKPTPTARPRSTPNRTVAINTTSHINYTNIIIRDVSGRGPVDCGCGHSPCLIQII